MEPSDTSAPVLVGLKSVSLTMHVIGNRTYHNVTPVWKRNRVPAACARENEIGNNQHDQ